MTRLLARFSRNRVSNYLASPNGRAELVVLGFVVVYVLVMSYYTVLKHNAFLTYWFDLGIYAQEFWLKLQGVSESLQFTHRPILFGLLPVYALFPRPEMLLVVQSVILGLAALPLYWFARDELRSPTTGVVFAGALLLYPPLHGVNTFDFHVEAFLVPFFLFALYYLHQGHWRSYLIFTILILLTMLEASFLVGAMGLYALLLYRSRWMRLRHRSWSVSMSWGREARVALATLLFAGIAYGIGSLLSTGFGQLPSSLLTGPATAFSRFLVDVPTKLTYLVQVFGPVGFLAFVSPGPLVMAVPWWAFSFTLPFPNVLSISFQYGAFVTPFIFTAAVGGVRKFAAVSHSVNASTVYRGVALMAVTSLLFFQWLSPIAQPWPVVDARREVLHKIMGLIPRDASVLAQNDLYPHLTGRFHLYGAIPASAVLDYILVDTQSIQFQTWPPDESMSVLLPRLLKTAQYGVLVEYDGIYLYQLGYEGNPIAAEQLLR